MAERAEQPVAAPELVGAGGWINATEPLSLAGLRGKIVLLDFWTFCCINCLHIIEELRPLEDKFPRELMVIGVHSPKFPEEHDHAAVERAVRRHRIHHPVLDDPDMITWRRYGVRAWPTLVLIDAAGRYRGSISGEGHGEALEQAISGLIAEGNSSGVLDAARTIRRAATATARSAAGTGTLAFPGKVAVDEGGRLAIADTGHDRVLVVSPAGAIESVIEGLHEPQGLYFDEGRLIIADCLADRVVAVELLSGALTVLSTGISSPWDVAPWQGGTAVAEAGRHRLWLIDEQGAARVLAGTSGENLTDGPALSAELAQPSGLTVTPGGALVFADSEVSALRQLQDGVVSTLVGKGLFEWGTADGDAETARLQHPLGVAAAPDGAVYVADTFNSLLRVWREGRLTTLPVHDLDEPGGLCLLGDGRLAVADTNNHRLLLVDPQTGHAEKLQIGDGEDRAADERVLVAGAAIRLTLSLDLEGSELDPSDGPPVRLAVAADPPSLLAAGPRAWALDDLPALVELRSGQAGEGVLSIDLRAASCEGDLCRLFERKEAVPVRLSEAGAHELVL